jgi:transposase
MPDGKSWSRCIPGVLEHVTSTLFWLSDDPWAAVEPHLPNNQPGARRVDDRRVISGIIHGLKIGRQWHDRPAAWMSAPGSVTNLQPPCRLVPSDRVNRSNPKGSNDIPGG